MRLFFIFFLLCPKVVFYVICKSVCVLYINALSALYVLVHSKSVFFVKKMYFLSNSWIL